MLEGIETSEHHAKAIDAGIELGQGSAIHRHSRSIPRPVLFHAFLKWSARALAGLVSRMPNGQRPGSTSGVSFCPATKPSTSRA